MLLDILKQFKWVDIFVIILLIRVCYVSFKTGFTIELFKLLGTVAAIFFPLHYYTFFSDRVIQRASTQKMPLEFIDFISFLILAIVSYAVLILLRGVFHRFVKMEAVPILNKWGGLILGVARGFLLTGLLMYMLVISSVSYFKNTVANSYSGKSLFSIAPATYNWVWYSIVSKFTTEGKINNTVMEVQNKFIK